MNLSVGLLAKWLPPSRIENSSNPTNAPSSGANVAEQQKQKKVEWISGLNLEQRCWGSMSNRNNIPSKIWWFICIPITKWLLASFILANQRNEPNLTVLMLLEKKSIMRYGGWEHNEWKLNQEKRGKTNIGLRLYFFYPMTFLLRFLLKREVGWDSIMCNLVQ